MKQWLKDFVHNCVVHPSIMFMPRSWGNALHDKNADWAYGKTNHYDEFKLENRK
jgi:hypothetical protein